LGDGLIKEKGNGGDCFLKVDVLRLSNFYKMKDVYGIKK